MDTYHARRRSPAHLVARPLVLLLILLLSTVASLEAAPRGADRQRQSATLSSSPRSVPVQDLSVGRKIAFSRFCPDADRGIYTVYDDGSNLTRLTNIYGSRLRWSPDGTRLAFLSNERLYVMDHTGSNVRVLAERMANSPDQEVYVWTPDSNAIIFVGYDSTRRPHTYRVDIDGAGVQQISVEPALGGNLSPDGSRLVFIGVLELLPYRAAVFVMNSDGSGRTQLTPATGERIGAPQWSPDGTRIAYYGGDAGINKVFIMDPDGSNVTRITPRHQMYSLLLNAWSPDGTALLTRPVGYSGTEIISTASGSQPLFIANEMTSDSNMYPQGWSLQGEILWLQGGRMSGGSVLKPNIAVSGASEGSSATSVITDMCNIGEAVWVPGLTEPEPPPDDPKKIDLSVTSVTPVQTLEGQPLVRGKFTAVRAVIQKRGGNSATNVAVRASSGASTVDTFYVADPSNIDSQSRLIQDNSVWQLNFGSEEAEKTVYFFDRTLTPITGTYQVTVTVDVSNAIEETNEQNNIQNTAPLPARETQWSSSLFPELKILFFPTDWGRADRRDFEEFASTSSDLLLGTYPIADGRFMPFHSVSIVRDTVTERDVLGKPVRGSDGLFDMDDLSKWVARTDMRLRVANPTMDRFVAVVPHDWFTTNTTDTLTDAFGVTFPTMPNLVIAEAGGAPFANGAEAVAHEVGHSYGLRLACEEYNPCNPNREGRVGNVAAAGVWPRHHMLIDPEEPTWCFMSGHILDTDRHPQGRYWVDEDDYVGLMHMHQIGPAVTASSAATGQGIVVAGVIGQDDRVTLYNWYQLPEAELSIAPVGPYAFEYQDKQGQIVHSIPFDVSFAGGSDGTHTEVPFVFTLPSIPDVARIIIKHGPATLAQREISAHAPTVSLREPNEGERVGGVVMVTWNGSDADNDILNYAILVSADNGATWETLDTDLTASSYAWDTRGYPASAHYLLKVIATDALNTGYDVSNVVLTGTQHTYLPITQR